MCVFFRSSGEQYQQPYHGLTIIRYIIILLSQLYLLLSELGPEPSAPTTCYDIAKMAEGGGGGGKGNKLDLDAGAKRKVEGMYGQRTRNRLEGSGSKGEVMKNEMKGGEEEKETECSVRML